MTPQIYSQPCPDTNRAFLCVTGHDGNLAEVYSVGTCAEFSDSHDTASKIAKALNSHEELMKAASAFLDQQTVSNRAALRAALNK